MNAVLIISGFHQHICVPDHTDYYDMAFFKPLPDVLPKYKLAVIDNKMAGIKVSFFNTGRRNEQGEMIFEPL